MTRRIILAYLALTALALALLAAPLGVTFAHREHDRLLFDAERKSDAVVRMIDDPLEAHTPIPAAAIIASTRSSHSRVVIVDAHGIVLLDTAAPGAAGQPIAPSADITAALRGRRVSGQGEIRVKDQVVAYSTVPTTADGRVNGAVRVTYPTAALDERVRDVWLQLGVLCAGVLVAVALVGLLIARGVTRPLRRLENASARLGEGDLGARLDETDGPAELRRVARTFNRMAAQLSELVESQRKFVANASHQLRTPLTALRLRLENMTAASGANDRDAIDAAAVEVTRLSRLVDGLLMLANEESTRERAEPVDVASIARDRAGAWSDLAGEQGVELAVEAPDAMWALTVPTTPEQLLDNLIDNALNASPPGATITVVVQRAGDAVDLRVLDRGAGLDDDERTRAFDRFWRAPHAADGGTGLGLAIVRQLAEAGGGTCRLDARPGGGIEAVVTLPAAREPAQIKL